MGKRTRDEVIYSRVDYRVKQEFELQMKESGNKTLMMKRIRKMRMLKSQ